MILSSIMTSALAGATGALVLTTAGALSARALKPREYGRRALGPYRTTDPAAPRDEARDLRSERLVAAGSALLAFAAAPALIAALLSLKWEGIGVTLLPALLVVIARVYASLVTFRGGDLGAARTIAHASLLLDVPLFVFSLVHMRFIEDGVSHETISLAAVAGAFALADGLQATLVLSAPFAARARLVRE